MQLNGQYVLGQSAESVQSLLRFLANGSSMQFVVARPTPPTEVSSTITGLQLNYK